MAAGEHGKDQPDQRRLLGRCWEIMPSTLHPASGGALETKQRSWGSVSSIQFRIICRFLVHACVLSRFHCLTLCDHVDCSSLGSPVCGIHQPRILEWATMPSSRGSSQPRDRTHFSYGSSIGRRVLYCQCHLGILQIPGFHLKSTVTPGSWESVFYQVTQMLLEHIEP